MFIKYVNNITNRAINIKDINVFQDSIIQWPKYTTKEEKDNI